jgi:hypothetical protein
VPAYLIARYESGMAREKAPVRLLHCIGEPLSAVAAPNHYTSLLTPTRRSTASLDTSGFENPVIALIASIESRGISACWKGRWGCAGKTMFSKSSTIGSACACAGNNGIVAAAVAAENGAVPVTSLSNDWT